MNQENEQKLFNRFDFFHPERSIKDSLMAFGFECGDGWYSLIWELCEDIETALKNDTANEATDFPFRVMQVKEKYGGLRFYTNWGTDEIFALIDTAEEKSTEICEICGKPGELNKSGWLSTRCEEHRRNR